MSSGIIEKLQWRYATKKFDTTKILSDEKLSILKKAFNLTATSYGLQPIKMVVITSAEIKKQLVQFTNNQIQVADASHVLVLCTETEITSKYIKDYFNNVEEIRKTPREILHPFETFLTQSFSEEQPEKITSWMEKQAYLAMGNLLTVCAIEDIDACPIEGFEPAAYDKLLKLKDKNLQSVLVLAVGYRATDDIFSEMKKVRRGVEEVIVTID